MVTDAYLATLPGRAAFAKRLTELYNYERYGLPQKAGSRYFYTRNDGLQPQSALYVRDGLNGTGRVLIDPNTWAKDGATALGEWEPSPDGRHLLYAVQDGGTDWRIVRDVASLKGEKVNYLSLMLVQNPKRQRGELRRGCRKRKAEQQSEAAS